MSRSVCLILWAVFIAVATLLSGCSNGPLMDPYQWRCTAVLVTVIDPLTNRLDCTQFTHETTNTESDHIGE